VADGVEVIYVDEVTLLGRRDEVEHELAQIRSMRTERECLDELDQIAFLLGCETGAPPGLRGGRPKL
jgi:hypothetical protein